MSIPITEKLIQRQINHWNGYRKYLTPDRKETVAPRPLVITISRLAGSGGRHLASGLCQRLDLRLHDRSLVEQVMRQENLPPALAAEMDEQVASQSSLWIKGLFNRRIFLIKEYEHALRRTITTLADTVGGVFLGRGANLVLADRADLRLRVVAGTTARRRRLQQRLGLSRAEARVLLGETDHARSEFVDRLFGADPDRTGDYDLTINTDRIPPDEVVELSLTALLARVPPDEPAAIVSARATT